MAVVLWAFASPRARRNRGFRSGRSPCQCARPTSRRDSSNFRSPNLQSGDRLWIQPDLPDTQSAHYLMIVVFLRGATNPAARELVHPHGNLDQASARGGNFCYRAGRSAGSTDFSCPGHRRRVQHSSRFGSRPARRVRACMRRISSRPAGTGHGWRNTWMRCARCPAADPDELKARTLLLARSLNIRLEQQCFDKPTAQQAPCLTQNTDQLVLDDAHAQNMVDYADLGCAGGSAGANQFDSQCEVRLL